MNHPRRRTKGQERCLPDRHASSARGARGCPVEGSAAACVPHDAAVSVRTRLRRGEGYRACRTAHPERIRNRWTRLGLGERPVALASRNRPTRRLPPSRGRAPSGSKKLGFLTGSGTSKGRTEAINLAGEYSPHVARLLAPQGPRRIAPADRRLRYGISRRRCSIAPLRAMAPFATVLRAASGQPRGRARHRLLEVGAWPGQPMHNPPAVTDRQLRRSRG
jgi:hypothetical protein